MKVLIFSARNFEKEYLKNSNNDKHKITFTLDALSSKTAIQAVGFDAVSIFSGDIACNNTLEKLKDFGVKYVALRSAGYDNVNIRAAAILGIKVANVPNYSPYAIAEYAAGLLLVLNRKLIEANNRVKHFNFSLDNLVGFDLNDKTIGVIGTGKIGSLMVKIMHGFGCHVIGYDITENSSLVDSYNLKYMPLETLCKTADIISIHVPLNTETHHLIDESLIEIMKPGVLIINTARGAVVETSHVIKGLKNKTIGGFAMDVYEKEHDIFFKDLSNTIPTDDMLITLNVMPNVLITGHQAFLTKEALTNIAETTIYNLDCWSEGLKTENELYK
ncbi:2-hydroxyacid dehydrogenase [Olleya sp. HaHaR_3_96]|uniref:2-hydroxyacid dehydrogenase n=1 Tax=Olleya sp. HaHaR_3_96 TaxID=2745560 RepID=UPI001C5003CC|nr:2-hydroxyacid dehydrogenase [Olleya sp. HaHaR_3_96]QXP58334.1 2-hydroxyacid dehydrogenase [Olleya sp. HaHaR_3_96]